MNFTPFKNVKKNRRRQVIGLTVGILFSTVMVSVLGHPANEPLVCKGSMNTGHANMSCEACHSQAKGSFRQQLQAKVHFWIGMRQTSTDFGKSNVTNEKCIACHERDNDRHPVHRFLEPKYMEALKSIEAHKCESCHMEHQGARITLANGTYCQNCHQDLSMKYDPLDVSHELLIKEKRWTTCLQCHDYHGNHVRKTPHMLRDTLSMAQIRTYFKGGEDPYSVQKKYKAIKKMFYED